MIYVALAVIPGLLLIVWLYTRDIAHPEPKRSVYRLFLLGAAIVLPAGLLEQAMMGTNSFQQGGFRGVLLTAFFIAGMIEEFLKAAIFERSALQAGLVKSPMDAIVYAGAVALGFATVENILYVTSGGFSTAVVRSVTAVPAHFMFGIIMGSQFARSVWAGSSRALGYLVPAIAHGTYDTFALSNSILMDVLLVGYLLVLMEISLRIVDRARRLDRHVLLRPSP